MNTLYLKVPTYNELYYKKHLQEDPHTMDYNAGYDLDFKGYDKSTGCIAFPEEKWEDWYNNQKNKDHNFYAYICKKENNEFIGSVNFHFNFETNRYDCGILIEAKHRGQGYSEEALRLLVETAFNKYNIDTLYDNFPVTRTSAIKAFERVGFKPSGGTYFMKKFGKDEEIIIFKLEKKDYVLL